MSAKPLLIITADNEVPSVTRLQQEVKNVGGQCLLAQPRKLIFSNSKIIAHTTQDEAVDLRDTNIILRKAVGNDPVWQHTIVSYTQQTGGRVLNGSTLLKHPFVQDKLFQTSWLLEKSLPTITPTTYTSVDLLNKALALHNHGFPLVVKQRLGMKGTGVVIKYNQNQLNDYTHSNVKQLLIEQKFVPNTSDTRVLVVKDTVLGSIRRTRTSGLVNNASKGALVEPCSLSPDDTILCEHVAELLQSDYIGIDLIHDDATKRTLILEINFAAGFEGFEHATQINVAQKILSIF